MFKFVCDIVLEGQEEINSFARECETLGIDFAILEECGPGGGWPVIELAHHDRAYLRAFCEQIGFDEAFDEIEEIN